MSEVKVNKISPRIDCGTTQLGDAGDTITVTGDLKSNSLKSASGSTITLGQSGDTIQLGCGATQTGFGRTGTVDWDTTAKTASFTAVSGNGYFVNTTSGAITVTLPATPSAGDIVSLADYTNTWQTNNVTVDRNGSPIGGNSSNAVLSTEGQSVTFVYVDGTEGWKNVQDSTSNVVGNPNLVATGGTITTCGNCKIHTFTGPGTFTVTNASSTAANNIVSYLVIGGGGGAGSGQGTGGGGAGGMRELVSPSAPYSGSPLNGYPTPGNRITVTATSYPITVGAGGGAVPYVCSAQGISGSNSIFSTIISTGGGGGGGGGGAPIPIGVGAPGGSGGGGGGRTGTCGGAGNTPPVSPPQGNPGGFSTPSASPPSVDSGGGGGGASTTGANGTACSAGGNGGPGHGTSITASPVNYAGGGGGGSESGGDSSGGTGGGGAGKGGPGFATAGTANTGGGGGGTGATTCGNGAGGSGIVVIRYKYQ